MMAGLLNTLAAPLSSQICTFHQTLAPSGKAFPPQTMLEDSSESLRPLSQRSPTSAASLGKSLATRIRYPCWLSTFHEKAYWFRESPSLLETGAA